MPVRTLAVLAIVFASLFSSACVKSASPDAGSEVVLVEKPWFLGHGGVDPNPVKTGQTWVAVSTQAIEVSMQPIRVDEGFDDLMSKDNVPLDFHVVARLKITDSVRLISDFGVEWYPKNVQRQFQNFVRDHAKNYSMPDLSVNQTAVTEMEKAIFADLTNYLAAEKIPVIVKDITVGRVNPPQQVMDRFAATAAEQQRIKTEEQRKLAEDSRKAAEVSRAAADRAYQEHMGLSSEQFVRLESMKMCAAKPNCVVVMGGGTPLVQVK